MWLPPRLFIANFAQRRSLTIVASKRRRRKKEWEERKERRTNRKRKTIDSIVLTSCFLCSIVSCAAHPYPLIKRFPFCTRPISRSRWWSSSIVRTYVCTCCPRCRKNQTNYVINKYERYALCLPPSWIRKNSSRTLVENSTWHSLHASLIGESF